MKLSDFTNEGIFDAFTAAGRERAAVRDRIRKIATSLETAWQGASELGSNRVSDQIKFIANKLGLTTNEARRIDRADPYVSATKLYLQKKSNPPPAPPPAPTPPPTPPPALRAGLTTEVGGVPYIYTCAIWVEVATGRQATPRIEAAIKTALSLP